MAIEIVGFPYPPSVNECYITRSGYRIKNVGQKYFASWRAPSKKLETFYKECEIWTLTNNAQAKAAFEFLNKTKTAEISATFYTNRSSCLTKKDTPKRFDISNRVKALHDALARAIGIDDCIFWKCSERIALIDDSEPQNVFIELSEYLP